MTTVNRDKLWEKSNAAFGGFVPGIHGDMVCRGHSLRHHFLQNMLLHVARYTAIALLASIVGLAESYWVTWNNWHRHSDISDFPIMVPGGGANIAGGYLIHLSMSGS